MASSKHIDIICLAAALLSLLITVLFMNGEALGLTAVPSGGTEDGQFTADDCNPDWDRNGATRISLNGSSAEISGNGAYPYDGGVYIASAGKYVISGELTDGSIVVNANRNDMIWLLMDGVSLYRSNNAAFLVEQAGKVFLTLADGTDNFISSGAVYTEDAVSAGVDGAVYARDDLTVNGNGSLSVSADYRHAVVCNDDLVITGGTVSLTAVQDGIHANDSVRLSGADITIQAGDDGITVSNDEETGYVYIASGSIDIPACYEGVEAISVTIAGGTITIRPDDDGINANGKGDNSVIQITGGDITIINESGRDADGLDSNGDIHISGGRVFISVNGDGGSCALDCGSENGGVCDISGGTVVAAGGSAMAEGFDAGSEQCFLMFNSESVPAGTEVVLSDADGNVLLSEAIPCPFSSVVISLPELEMGENCVISIGGAEETVTIDNTSASDGFRPGGMPGRPQGMPENGPRGGKNMDGGRPGGGPGERMGPPPGEGDAVSCDFLPVLILSVVLLGAGLVFALLFKQK